MLMHHLSRGPQVADQLDAIPFLCRFQYARTAEYLLRFLDPLVAAYTEAATPGTLRNQQTHELLIFKANVVATERPLPKAPQPSHVCIDVVHNANHNDLAAAPGADMPCPDIAVFTCLYDDGLACATGKVEAQALAVMEGQLTWLVHLVGAIIRGRLSSSSAESQVSIHTHTSCATHSLTVSPAADHS